MGINQQESYSDLPHTISKHNTIQEVSEYLNNLVKQYCISELFIPESRWELYSNKYSDSNNYLPHHPFYEYEKDASKRRNEYHIADFIIILETRINERIGKVFKNGLHKNQSSQQTILTLIPPTRTQLEDMKDGITEWSLRFSITKHLTPRFIKDGDKGTYPLYFEIYVSRIQGTIGSIVQNANAVVLPSSNRNYKISILSPKKRKLSQKNGMHLFKDQEMLIDIN